MQQIEKYPDGSWTVADNTAADTASLWCRGNVGEVFPNVMTPMTSSLYVPSIDFGQLQASYNLGAVTKAQREAVESREAALTAVFAGYLYGNVTMARTAAARAPGMSVEMIDEQMFGLHDAPTRPGQKGEIELGAIARSTTMIAGLFRRPDMSGLLADQQEITAYAAQQPDPPSASSDQLLATAESARPWIERMMCHLLERSALSGLARNMLEQIVAPIGDRDLVNRLTAGIGSIESAEPPRQLWQLGRRAAAETAVAELFDQGLEDLDTRLRATPDAAGFVAAFDDFRHRHRARGPDEWELASATWDSDPRLALGMIERLRHSPAERDPAAAAERLAREAAELAEQTKSALSPLRRPLFDRTLRAATAYAVQREATKAAFMRAIFPARAALAELARRSPFSSEDFYLLRFEEITAALADPNRFGPILDERGRRRRFLQTRVPPFWFEEPLPDPNNWPLREADHRPDPNPRELTGLAVCPGVATGPARVVTDPRDPRAIEPGDILVAPLTDPSWTPLFLAAAGVVVDVGAQQSHAAIVARELGIPAVVSVTGASTTIPDGVIITVDGSAGTVTVTGQ